MAGRPTTHSNVMGGCSGRVGTPCCSSQRRSVLPSRNLARKAANIRSSRPRQVHELSWSSSRSLVTFHTMLHHSEDVWTSPFFVKRRKHLSKMFTKKAQARTCVMVQERSVLISTGCLRDIHDNRFHKQIAAQHHREAFQTLTTLGQGRTSSK